MTPDTRVQHFLARAAGKPAAKLKPETNLEHFLQDLIDAIQSSQGGGVTEQFVADYVTAALDGYATEAFVSEAIAEITDADEEEY